jgi:hypothetical protein
VVKHSNALDLNELLQHELGNSGLCPIFDLVAQHSWWLSPKVYREIQVVYPKTRRKKGLSERRGQLVEGIRLWDNQPASRAFWMALGQDPSKIKNFFVCHVYEASVWEPSHFTNLANLTAFPASEGVYRRENRLDSQGWDNISHQPQLSDICSPRREQCDEADS